MFAPALFPVRSGNKGKGARRLRAIALCVEAVLAVSAVVAASVSVADSSSYIVVLKESPGEGGLRTGAIVRFSHVRMALERWTD